MKKESLERHFRTGLRVGDDGADVWTGAELRMLPSGPDSRPHVVVVVLHRGTTTTTLGTL